MPIVNRGGGATSSSNLGDLNAPAWKAGGPTSGTGAWGSVSVGTEESLVLGYPDATGTAGFVSLQCTGDTDSFQLTEVEGEDIGTPQTFSALTNDHDLMFIAFKGTLSGSDRNITIKVLPIYNGGAAKTMTINVIDHEGNTVGSTTASATVSVTTLVVSSHSDFNSSDSSQAGSIGTDDLQFGAVVNPGGAPAGTYTGLYRPAGPTGWTNWIRIDKQIDSGAYGFLEWTQTTPTAWAAHWIFGLTYKTDYDTAFPAQTPAVGSLHHRWGHYNYGGGSNVANDFIANTTPSFDYTGSWSTPPQSMRIEWNNNVVTFVESTDGWQTKTVLHTYTDQIDIATNGNMVAYFCIYHNSSVGVIENIRLRGSLV